MRRRAYLLRALRAITGVFLWVPTITGTGAAREPDFVRPDADRIRPRIAGQATVTPGQVFVVAWPSLGLGDEFLSVDLSADSGVSWESLARSPMSSGRSTCKAPRDPGSYLLRLRATESKFLSNRIRLEVVSPALQISWGATFALGCHVDGRVRVWGSLPAGSVDGLNVTATPTVLPELSGVAAVACGGTHAVLVTDQGVPFVWGDPDDYGPRVPSGSLEPVVGVGGVRFVRASPALSMASSPDGDVFAWGLGAAFFDGNVERAATEAVVIPSLYGAIDIALGTLNGLALMPSGEVLSWGTNESGQLGNGTYDRTTLPTNVSQVTDVRRIAMGGGIGMAATSNGEVWTWGDNSFGQLGRRSEGPDPLPGRVTGLNHVTDVFVGGYSVYALRRDGALFAWGFNGDGALGDGTRRTRARPRRVRVGRCERVFVGNGVVHVVTTKGVRLGWGFNRFGMVGNGTFRNVLRPLRIESR